MSLYLSSSRCFRIDGARSRASSLPAGSATRFFRRSLAEPKSHAFVEERGASQAQKSARAAAREGHHRRMVYRLAITYNFTQVASTACVGSLALTRSLVLTS